MNRLRHTDELVGFLVLLSVLVLLGAILGAGLVGRLFQPTSSLRIVLPAALSSVIAAKRAVQDVHEPLHRREESGPGRP